MSIEKRYFELLLPEKMQNFGEGDSLTITYHSDGVVMTDIIERLEQVRGDNQDAFEAIAEIKDLRDIRTSLNADLLAAEAEIERLNGVIKAGKLCDPRHCTFGNENEIERLQAALKQANDPTWPR